MAPDFEHKSHELTARFGRVPMRDEGEHIGRAEGREVGLGEAEVVGAHDLALRHRNAADQLCQILATADLQQQLFHLAEAASLLQGCSPGRKLAQGLRIRRHPCQAMGRRLVGLQCGVGDAPARGDAGGKQIARTTDERRGRLGGSCTTRRQIGDGGFVGHAGAGGFGHCLGLLRRNAMPSASPDWPLILVCSAELSLHLRWTLGENNLRRQSYGARKMRIGDLDRKIIRKNWSF